MADHTCTTCGLTLDLADPHVTLVRQLEREQHGVVAVTDSRVLEYRHPACDPGRPGYVPPLIRSADDAEAVLARLGLHRCGPGTDSDIRHLWADDEWDVAVSVTVGKRGPDQISVVGPSQWFVTMSYRNAPLPARVLAVAVEEAAATARRAAEQAAADA